MKEELDAELCRKYPLLYADRFTDMRSTCMCWGFACSDGWYKIVDELSAKLEPLIAALPNDCCCGWGTEVEHPFHEGECSLCAEDVAKDPFVEFRGVKEPRVACSKFDSARPRASQVKEKYGGLRFYMSSETDEMSKLIHEAEELSYKTCEECGEPGELDTSSYWVFTLCEKCKKERPGRQ